MKVAYLVAGLAYGDEGKGATVDFLVRRRNAKLVVRYNGGSQAAHNVVTPDGRHHTFSQFGSGTFLPDVKTYLSRYMIVNPINMFREEEHLRELGIIDAFHRTFVDKRALVTTPYQRALNRLERAAQGSHASCGMGIGQTRADHLEYGNRVVFVGDLLKEEDSELRRKLEFLRQECLKKANKLVVHPDMWREERILKELGTVKYFSAQYHIWAKKVSVVDGLRITAPNSPVVFEGAQGVLLDEKHGEKGYNTWTNTTFENAFEILSEICYDGPIVKIGVLRTYFTRHGDGPFPTEDKSIRLPELHNDDKGFQGTFRKGHFDLWRATLGNSLCGGVDGIALNHNDCSVGGVGAGHFVEQLEESLRAKVFVKAWGPSTHPGEREFVCKEEDLPPYDLRVGKSTGEIQPEAN